MKSFFYSTLVLGIAFLCMSAPGHLFAQEAQSPGEGKAKVKLPSFMDWLLEQPEVKLELESDFDLLRDQRLKQLYQPAIISVTSDGGGLPQQGIQIKPRGKFRCRNCELPPVKIKLYKDSLRESGFRKMNELKLVMPCLPNPRFEQIMLKEFLVYRLYNLLTDRSYRVKLVDLKLEQASKKSTYFQGAGFLIEHEEEVANRLNGKALDTMGIGGNHILQEDYTRLQVFEFMIGNTDWIPVTGHNFGVIRLKGGKLVALPFDFDFSGLVSSGYSVPNSLVPIKTVQERFFMGNRKAPEQLEAAFALFRERKAAMIELIRSFQPLEMKERRQMIKYLESFFDLIDDPEQVRKYFFDKPPFQEGIY